MIIDKQQLELAMAKNCISMKELVETTGLNKSTINLASARNARPATIGKIAKALGVEVSEIIKELE